MLIKATANQASINKALASQKFGDDIHVAGGTLVMTSAFAQQMAASNARLACDGDVTIRMVLKPNVYAIACTRIAAMSQLGFAGDYAALDSAKKLAVTKLVNTNPIDASGVTAAVNKFLATLPLVKDARMFDAKPLRQGQITYNGKSYLFTINWPAGIGKGMLNTKPGAYGQIIEGFTWENGRMEGSSYNGSGIRVGSDGVLILRNIFRDCEDGFLSSDMLAPNPSGAWYFQSLAKGRADLRGFIADVDCEFDNCGAGGNAHGRYAGQALYNVSARAHVKRSNGGIGLKFHGDGVSVAYAPTIDDTTDSGGILQCVDFDCGPSYLINGKLTKASAGTGNYQAPVLCRNDREPIPTWHENRFVVMGNVITYLLAHQNIAFVRALNATKFYGDGKGGDFWPGVPKPISGVVMNNVFRCANVVNKAQVELPASGFAVAGNSVIDLKAAVPDMRLQLPNYEFGPASLLRDFADLISRVDPGRDWERRLFGMPVYPPGVPPAAWPAAIDATAPVSSSVH